MAVNELDKEHLRLLHMADEIDNMIRGLRYTDTPENEKKAETGKMVQYLEIESLDSKFADAGKDMSVVEAAITAGRTYWKAD